jgi:hypothetical protein
MTIIKEAMKHLKYVVFRYAIRIISLFSVFPHSLCRERWRLHAERNLNPSLPHLSEEIK